MAEIITSQNFSAGDLVTDAKLNNIVALATTTQEVITTKSEKTTAPDMAADRLLIYENSSNSLRKISPNVLKVKVANEALTLRSPSPFNAGSPLDCSLVSGEINYDLSGVLWNGTSWESPHNPNSTVRFSQPAAGQEANVFFWKLDLVGGGSQYYGRERAFCGRYKCWSSPFRSGFELDAGTYMFQCSYAFKLTSETSSFPHPDDKIRLKSLDGSGNAATLVFQFTPDGMMLDRTYNQGNSPTSLVIGAHTRMISIPTKQFYSLFYYKYASSSPDLRQLNYCFHYLGSGSAAAADFVQG